MAHGSRDEGGLLAMIVDQDTATGMLLTGIGHVDIRRRSNFLIVDDSELRDRRVLSFHMSWNCLNVAQFHIQFVRSLLSLQRLRSP